MAALRNNAFRTAQSGRTLGFSLLEVLAAAVILLIVFVSALALYFASLVQSAREVIDSEAVAISRSIEHALRAGVRANLAPNKRSFFADVEGVRVFVPLPQPGQPAVDLPDYEENVVDWDQDGVLRHRPSLARPETREDIFPRDGVPDNVDGFDQDGDGAFGAVGDRPEDPAGRSEDLRALGVGGASQAYDGVDSDGDAGFGGPAAVDDIALWLYPVGLLAQIDSGAFREINLGPSALPALPGIQNDGWGNWFFEGGLAFEDIVLEPVDEDLDNDGFVTAPSDGGSILAVEAGLNLNPILIVTDHGRYYPDTFEDRDGNGLITRIPGGTNIDTPGVGLHTPDFYEFSEDFNLNGFLDVPVRAAYSGAPYFHLSYGDGGGTPFVTSDPLTQGLPGSFPPPVLPGPTTPPFPYQTANYIYSNQNHPSRSYGYSLRVQRVEEKGGSTQGFGSVARSVFRFTLSIYEDYAETIRRFRNAELPLPVRIQHFEVIVE